MALGFGLDMGILDPLDSNLMVLARSEVRPKADEEAVRSFKEDYHAAYC